MNVKYVLMYMHHNNLLYTNQLKWVSKQLIIKMTWFPKKVFTIENACYSMRCTWWYLWQWHHEKHMWIHEHVLPFSVNSRRGKKKKKPARNVSRSRLFLASGKENTWLLGVRLSNWDTKWSIMRDVMLCHVHSIMLLSASWILYQIEFFFIKAVNETTDGFAN